MTEGRSHWSEKAKKDTSPGPPAEAKRRRPPRRKLNKRLLLAVGGILCVAAAAVVIAWYATSGDDSSGAADDGSLASVSTETPGATGGSTSSPPLTGPASTDTVPESSETTETTSPSSTVPGSSTSTTTPSGGTGTTKVYSDSRLGFSFRYPSSWTTFPLEEVAALTGPPTMGIAVADPLAGKLGTTPSTYIMFGVYEDPTQSAPPARTAMEEWVAMAEPEAPQPLTTIEPLTDFVVNGVSGASKTYSFTAQGRPSRLRVCFLSAGTCIYVFTFCADERDWDATKKQVFDAALGSFTVIIDE